MDSSSENFIDSRFAICSGFQEVAQHRILSTTTIMSVRLGYRSWPQCCSAVHASSWTATAHFAGRYLNTTQEKPLDAKILPNPVNRAMAVEVLLSRCQGVLAWRPLRYPDSG